MQSAAVPNLSGRMFSMDMAFFTQRQFEARLHTVPDDSLGAENFA